MRWPHLLHWLPLDLAVVVLSMCLGGADERVHAGLVEARSTGESVPAVLATVVFRNDLETPVSIRSYRLQWPGGSFSASPAGLRIPTHSSVERKLRIDMRNGDVASLLNHPQRANVELLWTRSE